MSIPTVSVVMTVFNGGRFLGQAVESILNQTFADFEFVIIDDGSSDDSASILESYRKKDDRIRVYHQENRGLTDALNRGCGLAVGEYIARMDADDVALTNRLSLQVEFMRSHPKVAIVGGAVEFIDASGKGLRIVRYPSENAEIQFSLRDTNVFWHPTVLLRANALSKVGVYRDGVSEDYDLWLRIAERFEVANLDAVLLHYRVHPYQISVRSCRRQAFGFAAAQAAAWYRRTGKPDPLDEIGQISVNTLREIGVTESDLHTSLARQYLSCIRNMAEAGEYSRAVLAIGEVRPSEFKCAAKWAIADFYLLAARVYWRQRRFGKSILSASQALLGRPTVLGRPIKPILQFLGLRETRTARLT